MICVLLVAEANHTQRLGESTYSAIRDTKTTDGVEDTHGHNDDLIVDLELFVLVNLVVYDFHVAFFVLEPLVDPLIELLAPVRRVTTLLVLFIYRRQSVQAVFSEQPDLKHRQSSTANASRRLTLQTREAIARAVKAPREKPNRNSSSSSSKLREKKV